MEHLTNVIKFFEDIKNCMDSDKDVIITTVYDHEALLVTVSAYSKIRNKRLQYSISLSKNELKMSEINIYRECLDEIKAIFN